jgi:tetratricopeptide (TPR) repeat protein
LGRGSPFHSLGVTNTSFSIYMRKLVVASLFIVCAFAQAQPVDCQTGLQQIDAKRFAEAIQSLSSCLKEPLPAEARAFVLQARAHAHGELRQWSVAVEDQKASVQAIEPKNVWTYVMLGTYLRESKRFSEALEALKSGLKYDEDGPGTGPGMAVYYHTAQTLHQSGKFKEAIEAMTKGIPKQPDYGYALYQRALSYEALDDRVQAKRDLFRAAELTPKDGYEPEIATKLQEYGFTVKVRAE